MITWFVTVTKDKEVVMDKFKNVEVINREKDFTFGDLTILCGRNNTGKTRLSYLLYEDAKSNVIFMGEDRIKMPFKLDNPQDIFKNSCIYEKYPDIFYLFNEMMNGYFVIKPHLHDMYCEIYFKPFDTHKNIFLTKHDIPSSFRSLLKIWIYLRFIAQYGDTLVINKPELCLDARNQRIMARLIAYLVNIGIKVFITTHSDYIIKELNLLIMLNKDDNRIEEIAEKYGYQKCYLINSAKIKAYMVDNMFLSDYGVKFIVIEADIDNEYGMKINSIDWEIDEMNRIESDIIWGN
jgi:predicted ATPase